MVKVLHIESVVPPTSTSSFSFAVICLNILESHRTNNDTQAKFTAKEHQPSLLVLKFPDGQHLHTCYIDSFFQKQKYKHLNWNVSLKRQKDEKEYIQLINQKKQSELTKLGVAVELPQQAVSIRVLGRVQSETAQHTVSCLCCWC